jgi:DNA-binding PadR family transcriptional regulator
MNAPVPDEVILGLLAAHPQHGYELLERFRSRAHLGRIWTMSTSQLYAVLKRLEREGLIEGQQLQSPDAPPRTEYAVTEAGLQRLHVWLNEPRPSSSIRRIRVEFLSRLYVASLLDIPPASIVECQKSICLEQRERLLKDRQQAASEVEALTLDLVLGQLEAALVWLERCKEGLPSVGKN